MVRVGLFTQFDAVPGTEADVARTLVEVLSQLPADARPDTWFAFRCELFTLGFFAAFDDDSRRQACLSHVRARLAPLLAEQPIELIEIMSAKLPGSEDSPEVSLGFSIRVDVKAGADADFARALQATLPRIVDETGTIAWFSFRRGPTTFGVFDVFPDEEARIYHMDNFRQNRSANIADLLAQPFDVAKVNLLAGRLPQ